jgi:hypothetical protein
VLGPGGRVDARPRRRSAYEEAADLDDEIEQLEEQVCEWFVDGAGSNGPRRLHHRQYLSGPPPHHRRMTHDKCHHGLISSATYSVISNSNISSYGPSVCCCPAKYLGIRALEAVKKVEYLGAAPGLGPEARGRQNSEQVCGM